MATEVVSTNQTNTLFADQDDRIYLAPFTSIVTVVSAGIRTRGSADSAVDVIVDGSVTSLNSHGISLYGTNAFGIGSNTVSIGVSGSVRSDADGRSAVRVLGDFGEVINAGGIHGLDTGVRIEDARSIVRNTGIIEGGDTAVLVRQTEDGNSTTDSEVYNSGTIAGGSHGVDFDLGLIALTAVSLRNSGHVSADIAVESSAASTVLVNHGVITGTDYGFLQLGTESIYDIVNSGSIRGDAYGTRGQGDGSVTNSGTIEGGTNGIRGEGATSVVNTGHVFGNFAIEVVSTDLFLVNSGDIIGDTFGVWFDVEPNDASAVLDMTNAGFIAGGLAAIIVDGAPSTTLSVLRNSGTIALVQPESAGEGSTAIALNSLNARIENIGTIDGDIVFSVVNGLGAGRGEVVNAGTIRGDVVFDQLADLFDGRGGTQVGGVFGNLGNDTLFGGLAADTLYGGSNDDSVRGFEGDDLIFGDSGEDTLFGGSGDDTLDGGSADDELFGGAGDDVLLGNSSADLLSGGAGDDTLDGGSGFDLLYGGAGDDVMSGGTADDALFGGSGDDEIFAGSGNDTLRGASGEDTLHADEGNNLLYGGSDDDELHGGIGRDTLFGGTGDDVFVWTEVAQSLHGSDRDTIADFVQGEDSIDLSAIMPGLIWIGNGTYSGTAGEVRFAQVGAVTRLYIDTDGNSASDFSIDVAGAPVLTAVDVIL